MPIDKLVPNDPRVESKYADLNGHRWHYLDAQPRQQPPRATVLLIHGFPDTSHTWRHQTPLLLSLGLRCLALDCMGYALTGPSNPITNLSAYTFKTHADAIAALAAHLRLPTLILGGHDWGGAVAYRTAQYYPQLITHLFSLATPYPHVTRSYRSLDQVVGESLPNLGYQRQWGSEERVLEKCIGRDEGRLRKFLGAVYGGRGKGGRPLMSVSEGLDLAVLKGEEEVGGSGILDDEELTHYTHTFASQPLEGPCNWYRTRHLNHLDDQTLPSSTRNTILQPTLFVQALKDPVLRPKMSEGMETVCPRLRRAEVEAGHWVAWEGGGVAVNGILRAWFEEVVFLDFGGLGGGGAKL
ncbi:hypothetical protein B0A50_03252 [Salinomyces thailandicus]|uniref:AB hydrolase-1 domain-containing protein n=1 Tax=Salinomyces thailandicus TaxID=706561 RepID=A0A4U0U4I6_9PEZI|nr:hypothetical protein B0A50_03252 [Salinomyces thailandica]